MMEKAQELGRLLGQTDEYKALRRARERASNDREVTELMNRLAQLESELTASLQRGEEPEQEKRSEYEEVFSKIQASPVYQGLVAAQSNFDRVVARVNEEMAKGMESGAKSGIILPS